MDRGERGGKFSQGIEKGGIEKGGIEKREIEQGQATRARKEWRSVRQTKGDRNVATTS